MQKFLIGVIIFIFAVLGPVDGGLGKTQNQELKTQLAAAANLIKSIEYEILRNKARLKILREKLSQIEKTRITQTSSQKSVNAAFMRLIRRPENMPLVAGLDLVRGERIISDIQNNSVENLNRLVLRNNSIARLTSDMQNQQNALREELKKRRTAHKKLEKLLSQKTYGNNKKLLEKTKRLKKGINSSSSLISAIISSKLGKKYTNLKNEQDLLLLPGAGKIKYRFGEKNRLGIHALGVSFEMLPAARIVSPTGGQIIFAGSFRNFGKTVILAAAGGYHILLSGLVHLDIRLGDAVVRGEPLGLMPKNNSNKASGPLLYFELRHLGRPINPALRFDKST